MILAGDVGGTSTRLALFERGDAGPRAVFERDYADASFADFGALLARFVEDSRAALGASGVRRACLGVAGPVERGRVRLTNRPWIVEAAAVATALGGAESILLNDFEAAAHGIDLLGAADVATLQPGAPQPRAAQLVIGAGTGLGVAYRVWCGERYQVVAGEGGHIGFSPADEEQMRLARWLLARLGRVSAEDVVSGPGLARIDAFLRAGEGAPVTGIEDPAAATARALDLFLQCYGAVAGDHALAVRAAGGVYVAGGIARRVMPRAAAAGFISAFDSKGVHAGIARSFPVHVVLTDRLGLLGAAAVALSPPEASLDLRQVEATKRV